MVRFASEAVNVKATETHFRSQMLAVFGEAGRRGISRPKLQARWRTHSRLPHPYAYRALALGDTLPMIGTLLGYRQVHTTASYAPRARVGEGSPDTEADLSGHHPPSTPWPTARRQSESLSVL